MFVKNKEKIDFKYRKGSYLAILKAMTVSYVDETKVSAKDLLDCYGQRIDIISRDLAIEIAPHVEKEVKKTEKVVKKAEKKAEAPKKVETIKKADLNASFIEQILGEIEGEKKKDEVKLPEGNEDVEDFLNGKTDDLPEGTQIISEEEALKLQAETKTTETKEPQTEAKTTTKTTKTKAKTTTSKPRAKRGSKVKKA